MNTSIFQFITNLDIQNTACRPNGPGGSGGGSPSEEPPVIAELANKLIIATASLSFAIYAAIIVIVKLKNG